MRKLICFCLCFILLIGITSTTSEATYFSHDSSKTVGHDPYSAFKSYILNTYVLNKYNIVSYGEPFAWKEGDTPGTGWMPSEQGLMTNKETGEPGEYKYLGYSWDENPITNDRWFRNDSLLGNVFNQNYSNAGLEWVKHNNVGEQMQWDLLISEQYNLINYIESTPFFDADHPTKGLEPTGYTLLSFSQNVLRLNPARDYVQYAEFMTAPTKTTQGVVKFNYSKNGTTGLCCKGNRSFKRAKSYG